MVGGSDFEQETGDVWHWDGQRWLPMATGRLPAAPGVRTARTTRLASTVVLTGGVVEPGSLQRHQDVWEWSGDPNDEAVQVDARPPE